MRNTRWSLSTGKDVTAATSEEALNNALLNWDVLQSPIYFKNGDTMIKNENHRVNFRSDTKEALGLILSHYFEWDGLAILKVAYSGLEDSNFHTENKTLEEMIKKLEGKTI